MTFEEFIKDKNYRQVVPKKWFDQPKFVPEDGQSIVFPADYAWELAHDIIRDLWKSYKEENAKH